MTTATATASAAVPPLCEPDPERPCNYYAVYHHRRLLTFAVPASLPEDALDFSLRILEFLGLNWVASLPDRRAYYCADCQELDALLSEKIPCYAVAALLRDQAEHTLDLDEIVVQLVATSTKVGRA